MNIERFQNNPIIKPNMDSRMGKNINGPSLIRTPGWLENPLGKYYLYFAHHQGQYIRLAYSDNLEGPWSTYEPGTLKLEDSFCQSHIASPDVHVDHEKREIRMYYHGPVPQEGQKSKVAISEDGIHFTAFPESLGNSYFRVFQWNRYTYALGMPGVIMVAKKYVPLLRREADIVVALTHIGLEQDKKLAAEVPQIDIIIGGHSHNQLDTPLRIPESDGKGEVIVVQAGDYGRFLGRLDIQLQKNEESQYHITKVEGQLLPIDNRIKEDMGINKLLKRYSEPLEEVICTSEVTLTNPDSGASPMGNLVVEILRSKTDADVALLDRGAVQGGIEPGDVTIADILRIHPWRNRVLKLTLTGAQLQQILTKHDILTAGCSFKKVEGEIKELNIGESPVDLKKPYKVVVGEYVIGLVPSLHEILFDETGYRVDTVLQDYLRQMEVISTILR